MLNTDADASAFPRGQRCALVAPRIRRSKGPSDVLTPLPYRAPKAHIFLNSSLKLTIGHADGSVAQLVAARICSTHILFRVGFLLWTPKEFNTEPHRILSQTRACSVDMTAPFYV